MTQLLFQRFSQSIGCCARLNRWLSYCCAAHWSFYFFLKVLRSHVSEKLEILLTRPVQNPGNPDEQVGNHVVAICFVQHFVPAAGVEIMCDRSQPAAAEAITQRTDPFASLANRIVAPGENVYR